MSAGIELENVVCDFGNFRAVDNVNVNIQPGEFFSFLGPSGCGKTTILRMISGFNEPTKGVIRIGGKDMRGQRPNQRPTALIFQNLALFPLMPIWENISFGLEVRGVDKATRRKRAEELLALVDLPDAADKMVSQLSGGQKQRVAIARALAVEPAVMLLDEPLSALDLKLRQHMRAELRAIQKRTGVTFIYITHDQGEALAMSDRVGVMSQGRLQQVANPRDIYNNPVNGFVASFVGENNILTGSVQNAADGMASFATPIGTFRARLVDGANGKPVKLYIRPEHVTLSEIPGKENSVPVTISDVAFEGNFIAVQAQTENGTTLVAELRNDGAATVPATGSKLHMTFDAQRSALLPDAVGGRG
ncbi:MAG: ABC transporter ATP-binding protein [Rhodobacterales bacterium RIFCSPHIGHO2_02_FULL_62_130]|nr:MAG: ABC transporter ATP-binding protein [Rhodobacterales bacterium RIFCSPHIGHO2_02_FULL_62_130]OHC55091.1 MAG: ABC transporter ATP-binding protein [Rhodobacterales bacterium RIFCSPHIGHO2_12_FULL_62_75]HCZ00390.1 ABC transporter ATP-binding protein [Rhodobacter sp.]